MNKQDKVTDSSAVEQVPVRRRNTQGMQTITVSLSIPIELNEKLINEVLVQNKAKSLIATELMQEALEARKEN